MNRLLKIRAKCGIIWRLGIIRRSTAFKWEVAAMLGHKAAGMKLILPESMDAPTIPEFFLRGLRDIDPALVVYWNRFRQRFVLDRCTKESPHTHEPGCERVNVTVIQDPDGGYMGPNDRTLDWIKANDSWSKYGTLDNQRRTRENAKADYDAKQLEASRTAYREAGLDNRVQLNKALHLMQQHDLRLNK